MFIDFMRQESSTGELIESNIWAVMHEYAFLSLFTSSITGYRRAYLQFLCLRCTEKKEGGKER